MHDDTGSTAPFRIGPVDASHAASVEAVRIAAYTRASEFTWTDEATLRWSAADDAATVIGLWDAHGALRSTVRATVYRDLHAAEDALAYGLGHVAIDFPALVLSRAATAPGAARQRLNSLIRYAYVAAASAAGLRQVVMVVYDGGPRVRSLRAAGYDLFDLPLGWDDEAVARARPLLASLPATRFEPALDAMARSLVEPLERTSVAWGALVASVRAQLVGV